MLCGYHVGLLSIECVAAALHRFLTLSLVCRNYNDNSQRTTSYAANVPTTASLLGGGAGANNPNAMTLTGPGGNSVSLGRKLLQEKLESGL